MDHENNRIIMTLDRPIRIVVFTPGEFMMILVPIILGVVLGGWMGLCVAVSGLILRKQVIRLNRNYTKRSLQGLLYWQLPPQKPKTDVRLPLSYVREYVA
jgi:type IV conjugative transfer system protein TraL